MANKTKIKNNKWKEYAWYSVSGVIFLFGLTIAIFSVIGDYIGATNFINSAEAATKEALKIPLDWRAWGLILIGVALVILLIALYVYGNKHEKLDAKESKKSVRTKLTIKTEEVIDATNVESATTSKVEEEK